MEESDNSQSNSDYLTIAGSLRDQTPLMNENQSLGNKKKFDLTLIQENDSTLDNSVFCMRKSVTENLKWDQPREDTLHKPQIKLGDSTGKL